MSEATTVTRRWYFGPSFLLFVMLLAVYLVSAVPVSAESGARLINVLTIGTVFFTIRAATNEKGRWWVGMLATFLFVVVAELAHALGGSDDYRLDTAIVLLIFAGMLVAMAGVVMRREPVTVDKIFAAASVFMLMGILFGLLFTLIEQTSPGAFTLSERDNEALIGSLVHYSFTTLTTVGYGNISPVGALTRSLSDIEAVIAQLYLAIVVARLVSLQITDGASFDTED